MDKTNYILTSKIVSNKIPKISVLILKLIHLNNMHSKQSNNGTVSKNTGINQSSQKSGSSCGSKLCEF